MVRMYEEQEVHLCKTCGLTLRVTFAAVPIEPLMCCDQIMGFLGVKPTDDGLDLSPATAPAQAQEKIYQPGEVYTCSICGIEVKILRQAQPTAALDCCGEGMESLGE